MDTNFTADPAVVSITEQHKHLAARTRNLEIVNAQGFQAAGQYLKDIKSNLAQLEEQRTRITKPLNATLDEINRQAKEAKRPWLELEAHIKNGLLRFNQEQERVRLIAQRAADEAARKERERLQEIADRAAAKARQEAQERREAAERARLAGEAEEAARLAAQAARIEENGQAKQDQFESRAQATVAAVIPSEAPKVSGIATRDNWTFDVIDPTKVSPAFMTPDLVKIGKIVKSLKAEAQSLVGAGVRIWNEKIIASGRA